VNVLHVPPDTNRGPRVEWRCPARSPHGHQCSQRQFHAGPCTAFKVAWWGIPKGVRGRVRRLVPVVPA
jgi:hypothetical protein